MGVLDLHGEHYLVATLGEFTKDENHVPVLKLEITFIEECVKRKAHIFFHEDSEIEIRWNETPGRKMILAGSEFHYRRTVRKFSVSFSSGG